MCSSMLRSVFWSGVLVEVKLTLGRHCSTALFFLDDILKERSGSPRVNNVQNFDLHPSCEIGKLVVQIVPG